MIRMLPDSSACWPCAMNSRARRQYDAILLVLAIVSQAAIMPRAAASGPLDYLQHSMSAHRARPRAGPAYSPSPEVFVARTVHLDAAGDSGARRVPSESGRPQGPRQAGGPRVAQSACGFVPGPGVVREHSRPRPHGSTSTTTRCRRVPLADPDRRERRRRQGSFAQQGTELVRGTGVESMHVEAQLAIVALAQLHERGWPPGGCPPSGRCRGPRPETYAPFGELGSL